ncbi:UNVERIFIED_CONTAM: hypothetical protein HDU68_008817 [Siphonaria sp. JEL0065]|nr:hypothetical protein HDU68_008817 [Siphonaria sp. JEL0065]
MSKKIRAGKANNNVSDISRTKQKTILDSPFVFQWPSLTPDQGSLLVDTLQALLSPLSLSKTSQSTARSTRNHQIIAKKQSFKTAAKLAQSETLIASTNVSTLSIEEKLKFENERKKLEKKRKRVLESGGLAESGFEDSNSKKLKADFGVSKSDAPSKSMEQSASLSELQIQDAKLVSDALIVGINSISKSLKNRPQELGIVFVCKGDIPVAHLYAHLPTMAYLAGEHVYLVGLPKGAEPMLSAALGMSAVAAFGIKTNSPKFNDLYALVKTMVQPPIIPWLPRKSCENKKSTTGIVYLETNLKTLNVPEGKGAASGWNNRNAEKKVTKGGNGGKKDQSQQSGGVICGVIKGGNGGSGGNVGSSSNANEKGKQQKSGMPTQKEENSTETIDSK